MNRLSLIIVMAAVLFVAWEVAADEAPEAASKRHPDEQPTRLATMYREDPLSHSLSLKTGQPGPLMGQKRVLNFQSDIDFGHYNQDAFTVGIEGGREGVIVDLGTQKELAKRYGYSETVGAGQGFASIREHDGDIVIRKGSKGDHQALLESGALFAKSTSRINNARVQQGHLYLVRITDRHDASFDRIAKILVVAHNPGTSVTIRWGLVRAADGKRGR